VVCERGEAVYLARMICRVRLELRSGYRTHFTLLMSYDRLAVVSAGLYLDTIVAPTSLREQARYVFQRQHLLHRRPNA